jgi:hypothetical protein
MKGSSRGKRWISKTGFIFVLAIILMISVVISTSPVLAKGKADWTFMVYLDADNNLDAYAYQNVEMMSTIGSTDHVNVVVLWDKYDDVANLYKITTSEPELIQGFPLNGMEVNMGDPETLNTFLDYTMQHFRASNNILVLWDHGDDHRGCCWDDHPEDHLSHQEITQALAPFRLEILAFDACVEGMIEVIYEYCWVSTEIDFIVATEGYVPYAGFPYHMILSDLVNNPKMSALALSRIIVDNYITFYEDLRPASRHVELAAIALPNFDYIVQQLGELTEDLETFLEGQNGEAYHEMIAQARGAGNLKWSEYGWEGYIDLPTFLLNLHDLDTTPLPKATALYNTLMLSIYAKASTTMKSANGLGIFFPNSVGSFQHNFQWHGDDYLAMQFPHEDWWDFLQTYWGQ